MQSEFEQWTNVFVSAPLHRVQANDMRLEGEAVKDISLAFKETGPCNLVAKDVNP